MVRNLFEAGYWDAVDVTSQILKMFDLTRPPVPIESIIEHFGIKVKTQQIYPIIASFDRLTKTITINPMPVNRTRFYLAHELGHYLLPKNYHEFSFNTFAGCLLIPHFWLLKDLPTRSTAALSDKYCVTPTVMRLRLHHIGLHPIVKHPF